MDVGPKTRKRSTYKIFELPPSLFYSVRLTPENNSHSTEICHLGLCNDERVNVEASPRQAPRDKIEYTGLVLDQTVEDVSPLIMSIGRCIRQNARNRFLSTR